MEIVSAQKPCFCIYLHITQSPRRFSSKKKYISRWGFCPFCNARKQAVSSTSQHQHHSMHSKLVPGIATIIESGHNWIMGQLMSNWVQKQNSRDHVQNIPSLFRQDREPCLNCPCWVIGPRSPPSTGPQKSRKEGAQARHVSVILKKREPSIKITDPFGLFSGAYIREDGCRASAGARADARPPAARHLDGHSLTKKPARTWKRELGHMPSRYPDLLVANMRRMTLLPSLTLDRKLRLDDPYIHVCALAFDGLAVTDGCTFSHQVGAPVHHE